MYNTQIDELRSIYNNESAGSLKEELSCAKDNC